MLNETLATENAKLRNRVEYLEEELRRRDEDTDRDVADIMERTGLTKANAKLFQALIVERAISRDRIAALCQRGEIAEYRSTDSHVKRLRRKLRPHGITITSLYGVGYCIIGDDLLRARAFMKGAAHAS